MMRSQLLLALWALGMPVMAQESIDSQVAVQTAQTYRGSVELNYLLYLPTGYESQTKEAAKKWPLLVFLHGAGERGDDLEQVKKHGPPKLVADDPDFPFVLISPQCPKNRRWDTGVLLGLIKSTIKERNIDPDRVYLTGLSMGGYGSWALAAEAPDLFAAVAPICGGGEPRNAEKLKEVPIWAFHGDADEVVPVSASQEMVDAIKESGGNQIRFIVYEGVGHDSWTETYGNEELYQWFLKHR